ncbi:hypothetical protein QYE76_000476 [Lolium multiflorum]|uniref:Arabidopsis retrotransposon Orf1 C-terminal domain-containing protein n=1 Tax=Lolium multiflorum TaxID=4521 RepID=A0AAD8VYS8_LOLMU|nr:hypothetical protein QYE76_000476 [Lolium multiflorum]
MRLPSSGGWKMTINEIGIPSAPTQGTKRCRNRIRAYIWAAANNDGFSSPRFVDTKANGKLAKIFSNTSFESSADSFISSDSDVDSFNFIEKSAAIGKKARPSNRAQKVISRQVFMAEKMPPPTVEYLNWSGQDIGFTIADHPQQVPRPGQSALILPAVIAGFDVSRVFIDGGSSLNLMYADTLRKMSISLANLKPTDTRFHGITPEKPSYPLGKINLDVQFGSRENYGIENLEFEVVDFPSQYHALLGRPAYARFMAVPHYTYLLWRLPGPKGPITIKGSFALSDKCDKDFHRLSETFGMQAEYMAPRLTDYDVLPDAGRSPREPTFNTAKDSKEESALVEFLREHWKIFAWCPADMPGVPRELAEHHLNLDPLTVAIPYTCGSSRLFSGAVAGEHSFIWKFTWIDIVRCKFSIMGKPRDTKIAILPSTTRKGTTLSTSAALDSPSVISKLVSPPQASNAGTSAESENSSHNCDDASVVLDNDGSLGSFLDATIARSRQIENTETPNENAATPVNSPESVEYSSDDLDEDYVELDDDFIEKCNATTDARKIKKLLAEHAVRYKLSPDPKFATSPINIRDKDYDFSLDLSHIAIVEKTPFCGTEKESAVEHMTELSTLSGLFSDDIKMRTYFVAKIFPFSLKDDAKTWYNNLPPSSIKSPKELLDVFFRNIVLNMLLCREFIILTRKMERNCLRLGRFCSLIRAQPDHDLEKHDLLDIFYSGLTIESRAYLDSCAGCVFRKRTPDDAEELLAKIGRNHDDWSTPEPTPTPIVKKRGMIKLNDEDMREAKKSLKEKGIKPEDVKNLPPIEDLCEITPPSSMIEDPLYPEGHPKRVEQDSQLIKTSAPSKKKKKKHKNVVESSEPVNDPNSISISDAETESGNEHDKDNDKNDTPDKEEIEKEPEKPAKNKKYTKEDFITEKHGAVIDCNKGMVTFNVDDKEHTVYFPKRIDKKRKMKKFKFGELFKKGTTSTGRPSRASTQIRRSYNEDVIAPSFAPEEDNGAPNASSFPCYDFLTNAGILDDFFTLVNRAGLATYVGDEREQYYRLTKVFVESFKFHNTQYEPTVAFKIYDIPVTMELEEFCRALDIAPVGTARRIDDNPRDLLELYRGITEDDCRTIQRGKIRNIQLPAIKYFAYYIATSILGRENTSNISSYHLAFLNAALTGETSYHLGSLIARRLSSRGPIFGGTIALRILTHLKIPLDSNDVPLTPRRLDIAAMKSHHFVTTDSTIDNMVYRMLFADGNEKEIPLPQPGLFNIDRQSWSLTKEAVEEHMKIQEFHQQHDSENAEPSYDYTVTYPDVSSSTYLEPGRSSSYYGDTTSWGPWE